MNAALMRSLLRQEKGTCVGKTKCGRGKPIGVLISSASCPEVGLVEPALDACFVSASPVVLIGDKVYGSDPLDASLRCRGVQMIAPPEKNRSRAATQNGRCLRKYKRRFKVVRFFSWLDDFRGLVVRWKYHAENYLGLVLLACIRMLIEYL